MSVLTKICLSFFSLGILLVSLFTLIQTVPASAQAIPGSSTLCTTSCPLVSNPDNAKATTSDGIAKFIINIARFLTYIGGAIAVLFLVYGGILYITDNGSGDSAKKGKAIIINAVIGLVIVIVAYTIVGLVGNLVSGNIAGGIFGSA